MLHRPKSTFKPKLAGPRNWLAGILLRATAWIAPDLATRGPFQLSIEELLKITGHYRVDPPPTREELAKVRRTALDPIWRTAEHEPDGMIPLRDHMMRLCGIADELANGHSEDWRAVAENLHLAASLRDLSADTDVYGDNFMCETAVDFDVANSDVAAKYAAGVIVFNLAWAAYEWAVEIASVPFGMKNPKGARGRDLVFRLLGDGHFPYLRAAVLDALDLSSSKFADFRKGDMRRMFAAGSMAGIGAEYLREFRNALVHGKLRRPDPEDWGKNSRYVADDDPAIRQFHANTRLTLLLIQILMRSVSKPDKELHAWHSNPSLPLWF